MDYLWSTMGLSEQNWWCDQLSGADVDELESGRNALDYQYNPEAAQALADKLDDECPVRGKQAVPLTTQPVSTEAPTTANDFGVEPLVYVPGCLYAPEDDNPEVYRWECDENAELRALDLAGADLTGAYLLNANLEGADLTGANLTDADLGGADLLDAHLTDANLGGADLLVANLPGADLSYANLAGADLTGAYLLDANLTGATLTCADLTGAYLLDANLTDANLSGVTGWATVQGKDAIVGLRWAIGVGPGATAEIDENCVPV